MTNYREAFVYKWLEISTNKWYLGYHKGSIDDGYLCSSRVVKPLIEADPADWFRTIIAHGTQDCMVKLERDLLVETNARLNPMSYNLHNGKGHSNNPSRKIPIQTILDKIEQLSGVAFWEHLARDYYNAVRGGDKRLIKAYRDMLKKLA